MRRLILCFFFACAVAGCNSVEVKYRDSVESIEAKLRTASNPDSLYTLVLVKETPAVMGSSVPTHYAIDGQALASLKAGQMALIEISREEHLLSGVVNGFSGVWRLPANSASWQSPGQIYSATCAVDFTRRGLSVSAAPNLECETAFISITKAREIIGDSSSLMRPSIERIDGPLTSEFNRLRSSANEASWDQFIKRQPANSIYARLATKQLERIESDLVSTQKCTVRSSNWAYRGTSCIDRFAHGVGQAVTLKSYGKRLKFEGELSNGYFSKGKITDLASNKLVYEGEFDKEFKYQGYGKSFDSNGSINYSGQFNKGVRSGEGVAYSGGKESFIGNFVGGNPDGEGTCFYDSSREACVFRDGRRIDEAYLERKRDQDEIDRVEREMARLEREYEKRQEAAELAAEEIERENQRQKYQQMDDEMDQARRKSDAEWMNKMKREFGGANQSRSSGSTADSRLGNSRQIPAVESLNSSAEYGRLQRERQRIKDEQDARNNAAKAKREQEAVEAEAKREMACLAALAKGHMPCGCGKYAPDGADWKVCQR